MRLARCPGINHVGPLLQHVTPLLGVLRFVVYAPRRAAVFVRLALLDPIAVESQLVEDRRSGASQIMHGKGRKR